MVGQVVKAKEWEEGCIGASTPDEVHSTEVVVEHRIEMNGWLFGNDMEMGRTKEEAWARRDKQEDPKKVWK